MKLELHDAEPAAPGEKHGPAGPTHCGNLTVEYGYQLEQWLIDMPTDRPDVVRVVDRAARRQWVRGDDGRFSSAPWPWRESVPNHPWIGAAVRAAELDGSWTVREVYLDEGIIEPLPMRVMAELERYEGSRGVRAFADLEALALARSGSSSGPRGGT